MRAGSLSNRCQIACLNEEEESMARDSMEFRFSLQRLLAALILILVPITVFGFYIALQADKHVHQMSGAYLRTITRTSAVTTSEFISQRITDVGLIANEPGVVEAITAANRASERLSDSAIRLHADQVEGKWNSPETDPLVTTILASDLAALLRRHRELNPKLLKITVADRMGATVAATDKPPHYFQTDSEYWRALFSRSADAVYVSDLHTDERSGAAYVSIVYPVLQAGSGRFIGAVAALVALSPLFAHLNQQQIARTGRLFLVRDDGTVINAPGITASMRVKSDEYTSIRDALGTLQGREGGYLDATLPNGLAYLIGFADTGLKEAYPSLGWIVIASQEEREAAGPIRNTARFALLVMILGLLMLTVLAAYVFLHRTLYFADLEMPQREKSTETPDTGNRPE